MKISIVTPCFNSKDTIEETIKSVINQNYNDIEYIIIDGGSTDGTLDVINKYKDQISHIVSEPDNGQYEAIIKGFTLATGDIYAWLNADDIYMPGAFSTVAKVLGKYPEIAWVIGLPGFLNEDGEYIRLESSVAAYPREFVENGWYRKDLAGFMQQESMFWTKALWEQSGGLNPEFNLAADFELWTRFAQHSDLVPIAAPLAAFRYRVGVQRSSVHFDDYETEVDSICENLKNPSKLWALFSSCGRRLRGVSRLFIWRKTNIIVNDHRNHDWTKIRIFRSLSRRSLSDMLINFLTERK